MKILRPRMKVGNNLIRRVAGLRHNANVWPAFRPARSDLVRSFRYMNYRVFYEINNVQHAVEVLRIRHGAQKQVSVSDLH
jgi:plasmid stabilization system protein ParE